jgi:hypothetical protein
MMLVQLARELGVPGNTDIASDEYTATWTTTFVQPLVVPAGSAIGLQAVALASNLNNDLTLHLDHDIRMDCSFIVWLPLVNNKTVSTFVNGKRSSHSQSPQPAWLRRYPLPAAGVQGGSIAELYTHFIVPRGSYTPTGLAERVTQATNIAIGYDGGDLELGSPFSVLVNNLTDTDRFWLESAPDVLGARLDFEQNGGSYQLALFGAPSGLVMRWDPVVGKMALMYAHDPMQDSGAQEITRRLPDFSSGVTTPQAFLFSGDKSGVIITSCGFGGVREREWASPANIFYLLGFDYDDLILAGGLGHIQTNNILPNECPGYVSTLINANLFVDPSDSPGSRASIFSNAPEFIVSLGQKGRVASNPPRTYGNKSPTLIIECDQLESPSMICGDGLARRVLGFATNELSSGGYVYTSLSAESVYTKDTVLTHISVRILDSSKGYTALKGLGVTSELVVQIDIATPEEEDGAAPGALLRGKTRRRRRRHKTKPSSA